MPDEQREQGERSRDGFSAWMGVLDAFRDAVEETIDEMRQRSDLSPESARDAVRKTMHRAQSAMEDARERLDLVPRRDLDALREELEALRERVDRLEGNSTTRQIPVDNG